MSDDPPPNRLTSMNLAVLRHGRTLAVPRWITADAALMDRLLRGARWTDGAWVELEAGTGSGGTARVVGPDRSLHSLDLIVLDNHHAELDLSTPARRAHAVLNWIQGADPQRKLDLAADLAVSIPQWHSVNTEDIPAACRRIARLVATERPPSALS